jgi:hypothetical protein
MRPERLLTITVAVRLSTKQVANRSVDVFLFIFMDAEPGAESGASAHVSAFLEPIPNYRRISSPGKLID